MNKYLALILPIFLGPWSFNAYSMTCPDPATTSLQWGIPPEPWVVNPFSPNQPQGEEGTKFVRANILVAGYGQGVMCTYRISVGEYSIWWLVRTKIPSSTDNTWIRTSGGYVCAEGLNECHFYVAGKAS
jgi:hypothetical protein